MGILGIARGCFRMDGSRRWNIGKVVNKTNADSARERMIARENKKTMMDEIVEEVLGGSDAAIKQSKAYEQLMNELKKGQKTAEAGSLAEAARNRMIKRQEQKDIEEVSEGYTDIGRDRANRKAYPAQ